MEKGLGELERARALYVYGSQFANPSRNAAYWTAWRDFEENHGNENTFRDMLRTQRSVEASFSHVNYAALDMVAASQEKKGKGKGQQTEEDVGMKRKFVAADDGDKGEDKEEEGAEATAKRSRRDEDDDGDQEEEAVVERIVPSQVFGGIASA